MSFKYINDFSSVQTERADIELNNSINNKLRNSKPKQEVEIFSKVVWGKDTSKYGDKVDKVLNKVAMLAKGAQEGNVNAKAEINSITTLTIQQPLMERLQLNRLMGNVTTVGMGEALQYEYYQMQGEMSSAQASSGSFKFPTLKKRTESAETQNATGGLVIDYRELSSGAFDGFSRAAEQVVTDITNQMVYSNQKALKDGIQNFKGIKNFASGITKTNLDNVIKIARRFGRITIMGDYDVLSEINDMTGFDIHSATAGEVRFSESVMNEISKTGLVKEYKGNAVVEIPNSYNMTQLNDVGDFYDLYLPTNDLWIVPQGVVSPLQIVMRSGLTTMTAPDINLRAEVTRFDIEYGNKIINQYIPFIGYIVKENK